MTAKKMQKFVIAKSATQAKNENALRAIDIAVGALEKKHTDVAEQTATAVCNAVLEVWKGKGKVQGCAYMLEKIVTSTKIKGARDYASRVGVKFDSAGKLDALELPEKVKTERDLWQYLEDIPFDAVTIKKEKEEKPLASGAEAKKIVIGQLKRIAKVISTKCVSKRYEADIIFFAEHYDEIVKTIATMRKEEKAK